MVCAGLVTVVLLSAAATAAAASCFDLNVHMRLEDNQEEKLETLFWNVANPEHPEYAKFLSISKLAAIMGASDDDLTTASNWLKSLGGSDLRVSGIRHQVTATFDSAAVTVASAKWSAKGLPMSSSWPTVVSEVVRRDSIVSTRENVSASPPSRLRAPQAAYNVANQKRAYGIPADLQASNSSTLQMVWGPGTFGYSKMQLLAFKEEQCPLLNMAKVKFDTENHGTAGGDNYGEGNLDTRMISSFGLNVETLVSNTNTSSKTEEGAGFGAAMLSFVTELAARPVVPHVLSLSLGSLSPFSCEFLCNKTAALGLEGVTLPVCRKYLQTQRQVCMYTSTKQAALINNGLKALGLRGVSIFGSSGDGGSHWSFQPFEGPGNIVKGLNQIGCKYQFPIFPSPSPYMISVGGTQWKLGNPTDPVAWEGSGGGFSWQFDRPDHQSSAVTKYFATASALPAKSSYNNIGRGYPDVSAVAVDGTSESSPTVAGIFSLVIDARLNAGLPPLGFLAPRLWKVAASYPGEAFEDVTEGNSKTNCDTGFPAASGWDPVTGWGRPVWAGLVKHFGSD